MDGGPNVRLIEKHSCLQRSCFRFHVSLGEGRKGVYEDDRDPAGIVRGILSSQVSIVIVLKLAGYCRRYFWVLGIQGF